MKGRTGKEQRRRIVVNAGFQVRYTLLLVGVSLAVFTVLAALYGEVLREEKALLGLRVAPAIATEGLAEADREFDDDLRGRVEIDDQRRILALAVAAAALVGVLTWIGIHLTFRAAGPALAVSRMLREMASGDYSTLRRLRDKDDFRFLEEDLFALRDALRREAAEEVAALNAAEQSLLAAEPGGPKSEAIRRTISTMVERKAKRFGL